MMPLTTPHGVGAEDVPTAAMTLAQARATGALAPLDRHRLRAQLGLAEEVTGLNVRRATELLLQRIIDYYAVIQYTGPGYVYGRVSSSWPSALRAEPQYNGYEDCWRHPEMNPAHPTCTVEALESQAGWLCTDTAAKVAAAEMARDLPEARELLNQARYAVQSLLEDQQISGVRWCESQRRLRTPGVRKVLAHLKATVVTVTFGIGVVRPVVLAHIPDVTRREFQNVSLWSMPTLRKAA